MPEILELLIDRIGTPIGELLLAADGAGRLRAIDWVDYEGRMLRMFRLHYGKNGFKLHSADNPDGFSGMMRRYFAGDLKVIDRISVATAGTPFQRRVWSELRRIPTGTAMSYGELAAQIHRPSAARAVGMANGANPISIVVPCHRVVGSDGSLTGYGGGLERKRWLLEHERNHVGLAEPIPA
jgi:methylated-DNA-[protein]-cysteine S-methyltransferase